MFWRVFFGMILSLFASGPSLAIAKVLSYGDILCEDPRFECVEIQEGDTWESRWPDPEQQALIRRLNRLNIRLKKGMQLAVPKDLSGARLEDHSPFPRQIEAAGEKQLQVDLSKQAWAAYDAEGKLVKWGPASGGKAWCPDVRRRCRTPTGDYRLQRKGGKSCKSKKFPIPHGGAPMPFCMFFVGGYALHGSPGGLPGNNASHGCIRLYPEDARWLNEEFVELSTEGDLEWGSAIKILSNDDAVLPTDPTRVGGSIAPL
jgi:L,D-transpeptidase ErfK/SrfK